MSQLLKRLVPALVLKVLKIFSESVLEDATLGNISFALNNSFEVVKSCKAVFSNKCLDPDESVKALDKKLFGDEPTSHSKDPKADAVLTDAPSTSVNKTKISQKPRKKRQPKSHAALPSTDLNPNDNKKIKLLKTLDSPASLPSLTESPLKKSDKDSSEALSDEGHSETSAPIKMLTKESAQPDDELLIDLLLQTLVGMGKRTPVALKVLHDELLKVQPSSELTPTMLASRLASLPMFIKVPALGPLPEIKNDQYYYSPELDWNPSRKVEIGTLVRKPRGCTLSSKQYYFKPLPKLPKYKGYGPKKDI
ncbi:hypothetical protein DSO57_1002583 [Entomophthora muscae]|uniref:Uncharacterized protein n=1 Tax=Entomophthora muscae TaxID=34485 RepID=A0ACC2U890_9FUNG|nr:hypothetical protein DSO57_1002583 [Entomophthora muscae]